MTSITELAEQIFHDPQGGVAANVRFREQINNFRHISELLSYVNTSDPYAFVYCSNMIKMIESEEFSIVSETRSEENVTSLNQGSETTKAKVYNEIIYKLSLFLESNQRPAYITKSIMDLIAISLKTLFEDNLYSGTLEGIIKIFLPVFTLPTNFNTTNEGELTMVHPRWTLESVDERKYLILMRIFTSMFEYVTYHSTNKSYYEYRRCIYIFRNSYLAYFLHFGVESLKLIFNSYGPHLRQMAKHTIQLVQAIFMYPFTLGIHEFQTEQDASDSVTGANSADVYFPNYFRNVICDIPFLEVFNRYFANLLGNQEPFEEKRTELVACLKIISRVCIASQYTFKTDLEKETTRAFSIRFLSFFSQNFNYFDHYYLNTSIDTLNKLLTIYDPYYNTNRVMIIMEVLNFLYLAVGRVEILIEEGRKNPFARIFELLSICIDITRQKPEMEEQLDLKMKTQHILDTALRRITGEQADRMMHSFGYDQPEEIECFKELFQFILPAFELNLDFNLNNFQQINLHTLTQGGITMLLHLCSQLLPKTTANEQQTQIILKFYELSKVGSNLASLRYLSTLIGQIMADMSEGEPESALWMNINFLLNYNLSFQQLVESSLKICINNFTSQNIEIINYSIQLFKSIYNNLKKNQHKSFDDFYLIVHNLLETISDTIFSKPQFYHKRRDFFNVISIIWINSDNIGYIYRIYEIVKSNISKNTPESFYQYLNDITGLLEPIDVHLAFEILTELILEDLGDLFSVHFSDASKIPFYFKEAEFMKVFCKLTYSLINDINRKLFFETHTKIPLQIHKVFNPVLQILAQGGNYDYPKNFPQILERSVYLNPLAELIPFPALAPMLKELSKQQFERLIRAYFEHIQRVGNLEWMYPFIESNAEYMVSWWEEAMIREMNPKVNFKTIAESSFWNTNRQRQIFAKLLFELGHYNREYWPVDPSLTERTFVQQFTMMYH